MQAAETATDSFTIPRRHPRHKVNVNVGVTPLESGRSSSGLGNDVSPGGLGLFAPVELNVGDLVFVQIHVPGKTDRVEVPATVRHKNGFYYGVEFEVSAPSEHAMRNICQILLGSA